MAHTKNKIRMAAGDRVFLTIAYVLLALALVIVIYPLVYVVSASVSSPDAVYSGEVILLPKQVTIFGYRRVFQDDSIMTGYANTLFYTVVGTLIDMVVTVPCGFALAQRKVPGKNIFMGIFMFTMYFGGGMIPTFLLIKNLGLYNTRAVLLILGAFNCYNCIICRTFFSSIPAEMGEAAAIDGCSPMKTFWKIMFPLVQPALITVTIFNFLAVWNEFFMALIFASSEDLTPVGVGLMQLVQAMQTTGNYGGLFAGVVIVFLPTFLLYIFLSDKIIAGVTGGGVKG